VFEDLTLLKRNFMDHESHGNPCMGSRSSLNNSTLDNLD
jgi:hypothetical protein